MAERGRDAASADADTPQAPEKKKRLGEKLVERGIISKRQLELALQEHQRTGELLGKTLLGLGFVTQQQLYEVLFVDLDVPAVDLPGLHIDDAILRLVPKNIAVEHLLIPLGVIKGILTLAMANPYDLTAIDKVQQKTGYIVDVMVAPENDVRSALTKCYGVAASEEDIEASIAGASQTIELRSTDFDSGDAIIELVDRIISQGVSERATDIHIEPEERLVRTRYRVDGVLRAGPAVPKGLQPALASRIKVIAGLDIAETRLPQDGRMVFREEGKDIDIRVSFFPTANGENIVLRVLDKLRLLDLKELGMAKDMRAGIEDLFQRPQGIVFVSGPTGSGKTTTMYSVLKKINTIEKNIVTIEDPIEYELPMIRQCHVNHKIGLTFAAGLRSILRQDPDVIMVGEVRDLETAKIATSSALTGHLVLSSIHTNSAAGTLPRLMDMGVEPFLASSAVVAVMALRLVRTICPRCKEVDIPSDVDMEWLKIGRDDMGATPMLCHGRGCEMCNGTGYRGRTGIFELLPLDEDFSDLIMKKAPESDFFAMMGAKKIPRMVDDGREKVINGVTTIAEVVRVLQQWGGSQQLDEWEQGL